MKGSIKLLRVKGISLYLHVTLFFFVVWLFVLFVISGMRSVQLFWSLLFLVALFSTVFLHELGHAVMASFFGINAKKITLYPIGGIASIEKLPQNPGQELLISAAGPATNFFVALLCWLLSSTHQPFLVYQTYNGMIDSSNFIPLLGLANLALAAVNLIPAFPLDGGRMLRAILAIWTNYVRATAIVTIISKIVAAGFILYGLLTLNFLVGIAGLFALFFAHKEEAYLQLKSLVQGLHVSDILMYDYNSLDGGLTAHGAASFLQQNHSKNFIVMDHGMPVGIINRMTIVKAIAEKHYDTKLTKLMSKDLQTLEADTLVDSLLDRLSSSEEKIYPVLDHNRFVGVTNFQHIIEYLLLHTSTTNKFIKTKSLAGLV